MSSQRISLSNPVFAGRVKKYDAYVHSPDRSSRKHMVNQPYNKALTAPQPIKTKPVRAQQVALHAVALSRPTVDNAGVLTRQFSDDTNVVYASSRHKQSRMQKVMYVFGVLVFIFAAVSSVQTLLTNKQAQEQIATLGVRTDEQGVSEGTGDSPSEEGIPDSAISAYQVVNPEDPRYLRIPSLGVFARIKNLGLEPGGAVDAPKNIHDVGWYNGSVRPGSTVGSSLLLAHVSGWTSAGVFKNIKNLQAGAQFEVEKGSGEKLTYEVVRSESVPLDQVDMGRVLSSEESGKHDLKLMTCSGRYNSETRNYEERLIVYARFVK